MLITILVILIVLELVLYAMALLPLDGAIVRLMQLVAVVIAAIAIAQRAGLA